MTAQLEAALESLNGLKSSILRHLSSMTENLWPFTHVKRRVQEGKFQLPSELPLFIQ